MTGALYVGTVEHRRYRPIEHRFGYRVAYPLIDLDAVEEIFDRSPLWGRGRGHPVRFARADYDGDPARPLADHVRDLAEAHTGDRPTGPVLQLAHLRTLGRCFNPIALYWCHERAGSTPGPAVVVVTNTPWGERETYVVDPVSGENNSAPWLDKALHVSPFMAMDLRYRISLTTPGEHLSVRVEVARDGDPMLDAVLELTRRPLDRSTMSSVLVKPGFHSLHTSAAIYLQAVRLWRGGAPYHPNPNTRRLPSWRSH